MYPLTPEQLDNYDEFIQEHRDDPGGGGGGGGGGTTNYNDLTNKPSINGTVLSGNKSLSALGIASAASVTEAATKADNAATKADAAAASASSALTVATAANEKAMEVAEVVETKADVNTLNAVAARVGVNETNIATLQDTTATHTSDIADLQSTDTALGTRIGTINTTIGSMDDLSPASDTLVEAINKAYNHGGDSGTTDYSDLDNKPSINDVTLEGNKTLAQLGVAAADDLTSLQEQVDGITVPTKTSELENDSNFVDTTELATKQDIMQVTTLPSASAAYEGKVYQLIPVGTFYRCVHNISDDLYVWEATDATITNAISTIQGDDTNSSMRQVAEDVVSTLPAAIVPRGTIAFADLPALADASVGDMYNISDDFTTTADFVTPNVDMTAGSNVYVIDNNGAKKWDVFYVTGAMDLSAYQTKALTATTFDSATVEAALTQAETEVDANATAISAINDVIPSTATSDNKLVTATEIDAKQNKALDTEVQIGDNECATVEEAISATAGVVPETASSTNKLATMADVSSGDTPYSTMRYYATAADLPASDSTIKNGDYAWVGDVARWYKATVADSAITWAVDLSARLPGRPLIQLTCASMADMRTQLIALKDSRADIYFTCTASFAYYRNNFNVYNASGADVNSLYTKVGDIFRCCFLYVTTQSSTAEYEVYLGGTKLGNISVHDSMFFTNFIRVYSYDEIKRLRDILGVTVANCIRHSYSSCESMMVVENNSNNHGAQTARVGYLVVVSDGGNILRDRGIDVTGRTFPAIAVVNPQTNQIVAFDNIQSRFPSIDALEEEFNDPTTDLYTNSVRVLGWDTIAKYIS